MRHLCCVEIVAMSLNVLTVIFLSHIISLHQLKCHYCGHQEVPPNKCPNCKSEHIRQVGTGTQRVEELLQENFQEAKIILYGC